MAKIIKQTLEQIDGSYYKMLKEHSEDSIANLYSVVSDPSIVRIARSNAKSIAKRTGFSEELLFTYLQEQSQVNLMHLIDSGATLNDANISSSIGYSYKSVQSRAYSGRSKAINAEDKLEFLDDHRHTVENSRTVAIEQAKNEMAAPLLGTLINRKDQLEFLTSILTVGKEQTKVTYKLEEKNFNKKLNRAIETINKNIKKHSEDYAYTKALVNEIIETAINEPLTEDEEIEESYYETVSGY